MEMAFALFRTRIVVLEHLVMSIEWEIEASISIMPSAGLSKFSISHLLPSSSFRGGFLVLMLSGLGFFPGIGDFPRPDAELTLVCESDLVGTVAPARNEGFLCV